MVSDVADGFRLIVDVLGPDFIEAALPFLLVFVITFAVLEKTKILGEGKKNLNVMVALILGFSVVFAHTGGVIDTRYDPVNIINGVLPQVSLLAVGIIMLMVIIGVFAHDRVMLGVSAPGWIALFSIIAIIFIFGVSAGWWGTPGEGGFSQFFW